MNRILNKTKSCYLFNRSVVDSTVKPEIFSIHFTRLKSHYTCLGLDSNASQKDIKSAYYKLSLKYHPDKNDGCPEATEKFREITEAYEVLGNPEKKQAYDENISFRGFHYDDFRRDQFRQRAYPYRSPRTGRTKYYNYDEHYKQHYEEYLKWRQAEAENFKRRWEADRRARYGDNYRWEDYYRTRKSPPITISSFFQNRTFIYLLTFWLLIILSGSFIDDYENARPKKIYYSVKDHKEKSDDSED